MYRVFGKFGNSNTLERIQYIYRKYAWPNLDFSIQHVGQGLTKSYLLAKGVDWNEEWDAIFGLKNKMSQNKNYNHWKKECQFRWALFNIQLSLIKTVDKLENWLYRVFRGFGNLN